MDHIDTFPRFCANRLGGYGFNNFFLRSLSLMLNSAPLDFMASPYGVRSVRRPIGNGVMIIYDLTPAEWASGSVTMRFLVENYPYKVIPTFSEGSTMFGRYVGYISYSRYKIEKFKTG